MATSVMKKGVNAPSAADCRSVTCLRACVTIINEAKRVRERYCKTLVRETYTKSSYRALRYGFVGPTEFFLLSITELYGC